MVPVNSVPSLRMELGSEEVFPSRSDDEFPRYGKATSWGPVGLAGN